MSYFTRNLAEISAINEQMRVIKTGAHVVKRDTYVFMLKLKSVLIFYEYLNSFNSLLIKVSELSFQGVMMACAEAQKCLLKESSDSLQVQGAETENILEASQKNVNQVDKEMPDDLVKTAHPKENIQLLSQEAAKWTVGAQEQENGNKKHV